MRVEMTRWTVGVAPLVLVGLTLLLADAVQREVENEELTCPDQKTQLATKVIYCFSLAQHRKAPSPPAPAAEGAAAASGRDSELLEACLAAAGQGIKVITALCNEGGRAYIQPLLGQFAQESGLEVTVTYKPLPDDIYPELKFSVLQGIAGVYNAFVCTSDVIDELDSIGLYQACAYRSPLPNARQGWHETQMIEGHRRFWDNATKDLTPFTNSDMTGYRALSKEIHPFFRANYATAKGGKVVSIPFGGYLPYMYWRTDVFRRFNLSVPQTWEEVIEVARFLNRTNWDSRVRNKIPICFPKPLIREIGRTSKGAYLLTSILGSMVQYQGKVQGLLFDPASMTPLVNNTAMARALELYAQLAKLMPDDAPDGKPYHPDTQTIMADGYCALAFRWTEQFKFSTVYTTYLKGNIGMSILPGSTRVWDRVNNVMVDCTASLCHGSDAIVRQDPVTGENVTRYVNRVSYSALPGFSSSINAFSNRGYQEASFRGISYMGNILLGNDAYVYTPISPLGPMKSKQLTLEPASLGMWPKSYNRSDVRAYTSATIEIMAHPNTLTDLKMPSQAEVRIAIDDAARLVERDGTGAIPAIMDQTSRRVADIASQYEPGGLAAFKAVYWDGIGFAPPPAPPPATADPVQQAFPPPPADKTETTSGVAIGVSVPVGVSVIAVAVVAVLLRRRAKHRTLLGKVVPPGLGPLTTLLVTDIQSSTSLWDTLPQDVMESSVALHYAVLRRVAHVNGGHESATEGDSIILGFHDPLSATRAAVQAQAELLAADWPKGLLNHPLCEPKYAVPAAGCLQPSDESVYATRVAVGSSGLPPFPLWDKGLTSPALQPLGNDGDPITRQQDFRSSWYSRCCALRQAWRAFMVGAARTDPPALRQGLSGEGTVVSPGQIDVRLSVAGGTELISSELTVEQYLTSIVALSDQPPPNKATVLYRGLRVRIGVHTGMMDVSSVITNVRTGRLQYAAEPLAKATAVCSAGHGGMVLLSGDTFAQLDSASLATKGLLLASMGSVQLMDVDAPVELYQALTQQLAYRACFNAHLRYSQQLSPSFLDAPHDRMTVCFINAVGLAALNAWSSTITQASVQVYQCVAATQLERHSGYLVNSSAGMFVAVFKDPAHAIRWALCTLHLCLEADWDPALLEHELGEEVVVAHNVAEVNLESPSALVESMGVASQQDHNQRGSTVHMSYDLHGSSATVVDSHLGIFDAGLPLKTSTKKTFIFRGLRLKCAVDVGQAKASIEPSTGRVMYFGRTMNRCARVSAMTRTGQVWCTQDVWDLASPTINSYDTRCMEAADWQDRGPALDAVNPRAIQPAISTSFPFADLITCSRQASGTGMDSRLARACTPDRPRCSDLPDSHVGQATPGMTSLLDSGCKTQLTPANKVVGNRTASFCRANAFQAQSPTKTAQANPAAAYYSQPIRPISLDVSALPTQASALVCAAGRSESATGSHQIRSPLNNYEMRIPRADLITTALSVQTCGEETSEYRPAGMIVAGVPLGRCKLRGIQESVGLVQVRFDDQVVVQIAKPRPANAPSGAQQKVARNLFSARRASAVVVGFAQRTVFGTPRECPPAQPLPHDIASHS